MRRLYCFTLLFFAMNATAQNSVGQSPSLVEVAQFGHFQPIGVAVTATGRTFVTFPHRQPYQYGLAELVGGRPKPYSDTEWNRWDSAQPQNHFINVQAAVTDNKEKLWVLDPANPDDQPPVAQGVKLLKIDLATNKVERIYRFEDLSRERSGLNDVRIDAKRNLAYLSDPKLAAIVVLNLATGKSRLVLQGHKSVKAEPGFTLNIDGKDVVDADGKAFSSNVNGIALTQDATHFYYRAINQTKLYRLAADDLANEGLSYGELAAKVETVGETGISHGMIADSKGRVYLSDSPDKAIRYVTPDGRLETLVHDDRLIWPDTFAIGPDGWLYVTVSQINRTKKYNNGEDKVEYPFRLYKVRCRDKTKPPG